MAQQETEHRTDRTQSILVIDDDVRYTDLVSVQAEHMGHTVFIAHDGGPGIELFRKHEPDAVLVDLRMPEMDGISVIGTIAHESPDTAIIVFSGEGSLEDAVQAVRLGAWDYVIKDRDFNRNIKAAISKGLERSAFLKEKKRQYEALQDTAEKRAADLAKANKQLRREIAERERAEQALQEQLSFLQTVVDVLPSSVFIKDRERRYTLCNKTFKQLVAKPGREIQGTTVHDHFPADVAEVNDAKDKLLLEESGLQEYEAIVPHEGEDLNLLIRKAAYGPEASPDGIVGVMTDITRLKQTESRLRESENWLKNLLDISPLPVGIFDLDDNTVLYANKVCMDVLGNPDMIGTISDAHFHDISVRDQAVAEILEKGSIRNRDYLLKDRDGKLFWAQASAILIEYEGRNATFASFTDITERKQLVDTLRRFEFIANATRDHMTLIDRDYVYAAANRAYVELYGGVPSDIIGHTVEHIWGTEEFHRSIKPHIDTCFAESREVAYRSWFSFFQPEQRLYEVHMYPYKDANGDTTHVAVVSRDVTEEAEAQARILESREHFKAIFSNSIDPIILFDENMLITDLNRAAQEAFSLSAEQVAGQDIRALNLTDQMYKDFVGSTSPYLEHEGSWIGEWDFPLGNGRTMYTEISISVMSKRPDGPVAGYAAILRDITDRKLSERRLRETLDEMEALYQNTVIGIAMTRDQRIIRINDRGAEIFGMKPEKALGRNLSELFPSHDIYENFRQKCLQHIESDGRYTFEYQFIRPDGALAWCDLYAKMVDPDDLSQGVIWTYVDTTERRYSQSVADLLYQISNAVTLTTNLDELYGRIHEALNKYIDAQNFFIALHDKDKNHLKFTFFEDEKDPLQGTVVDLGSRGKISMAAHVVRTGRPLFITQGSIDPYTPVVSAESVEQPEFLTRNEFLELYDASESEMVGTASKVWLGVPLKVRGEVIGVMAIQHYENPRHFTAKDLNLIISVSEQTALGIERKMNEEALTEAKNLAEAASQSKSEFLANMSHEIRTPLNGVLGMLQLCQTTCMNEEQCDYVETALTSGRSLLGIINDILDFTKIEAGKMEIIRERFDMHSIIEDVLLTFRDQAAGKGISLQSSTDPDIPSPLLGGKGRVRQILFNLVGNAIKFTENGSVSVEVSTLPQGRTGTSVRLLFIISDTGIGIPSRKLDHIFEPFTQVDGSYMRRHQGTGLGLGIVKRLLKLMHGTMAIETSIGEGTSIYLSVPFDREPTPKPCDLPSRSTDSRRGLRILVVEDNRINRLFAARMFGKLGHVAETARNGEEALTALAKRPFDAVFMDVQMPGMDGVEATGKIRNTDPDSGIDPRIPVVAMTAHAMRGNREHFLAAGMDDYIAKPIEIEEVQAVLASLFPETRVCPESD